MAPAPASAGCSASSEDDGDGVSRNLSFVWGVDGIAEPTPTPRQAPRPLTGGKGNGLAVGGSWLHSLHALHAE